MPSMGDVTGAGAGAAGADLDIKAKDIKTAAGVSLDGQQKILVGSVLDVGFLLFDSFHYFLHSPLGGENTDIMKRY